MGEKIEKERIPLTLNGVVIGTGIVYNDGTISGSIETDDPDILDKIDEDRLKYLSIKKREEK